MNAKIIDIIKTVGEDFNLKDDIKAQLIGTFGQLDSLDFVRFIVAVEQAINEYFDSFITLVDDRAFTTKQGSVFRSIDTLAAYIERIIDENGIDNRCQ